ncbi:MAG: hypothetical protein A2516_08380 [Alphaproteobacteria bacterium RIFOXYD12_FULL_60_8]|nr:MAG: hypothetical protein A2516_08380 [Alphaproteobacteria bacterium RIFOXYD12_FULL_60_8]
MTDAPASIRQRPPRWAFAAILLLCVGIGVLGFIKLMQQVEQNTTDKEGPYVTGDCRVYEQVTPGMTHDKYRMAKICLQEDGTWKVVETTKEKREAESTQQP